MPLSLGPLEFLIVLALWLIPIALLVWFIRAVIAIRDSLRSIERRLESLESQPYR